MSKTVVVIGELRNHFDEVFICLRSDRGKFADCTWELPGGKVEPGEQPWNALVREWQEELKLDVQLGAMLYKFDVDDDKGGVFTIICYQVFVEDGLDAVHESEYSVHDGGMWVDESKLTTLELAPSLVKAIKLDYYLESA